jgi:hypothetical protein
MTAFYYISRRVEQKVITGAQGLLNDVFVSLPYDDIKVLVALYTHLSSYLKSFFSSIAVF